MKKFYHPKLKNMATKAQRKCRQAAKLRLKVENDVLRIKVYDGKSKALLNTEGIRTDWAVFYLVFLM